MIIKTAIQLIDWPSPLLHFRHKRLKNKDFSILVASKFKTNLGLIKVYIICSSLFFGPNTKRWFHIKLEINSLKPIGFMWIKQEDRQHNF